MKINRLILTLTTAAFMAISFAGTQGLVLKRTLKEGDVTKYEVKIHVEVGGQELDIKAKAKETIKKVEAETYTVESVQSDTTMNGNPAPESADQSKTLKYKLSGELSELLGDNNTPESYRLAVLSTLTLPTTEVKIGDTWSYVGKADTKTGRVGVKIDYKYASDEKVGDTDTVKIEAVAKETEGDAPATIKTSFWLNKATGVVVKSSSKGTSVPVPGVPMPLDLTIDQTLVP